MITSVFAGKPVIGIVGGIGSGKSFVAGLFGELGCLVISSDEQARAAYRDPAVVQTLRGWWGDDAFLDNGELNRPFVARKIFGDLAERERLERLIHPRVNAARERAMQSAVKNAGYVAFVWDIPLLFETELNRQCDAVVFIEAPTDIRQERVHRTRGWDASELTRREISQWPLDKKRKISDYTVRNTADVGYARSQVKDVLTRILTKANQRD